MDEKYLREACAKVKLVSERAARKAAAAAAATAAANDRGDIVYMNAAISLPLNGTAACAFAAPPTAPVVGGKKRKTQLVSEDTGTQISSSANGSGVNLFTLTKAASTGDFTEAELTPMFQGNSNVLLKPVANDKVPRIIPGMWCNNDDPIWHYADSLFYPTVDTDRVLKFHKMSNEVYLFCADEAKRLKQKHFRGVKNKCALFELTRTFRFEYVTYDYMHYILNCGGHFLEFFKGNRALSEGARRYLLALRTHPELQLLDDQVSWKVNKVECADMDSVVNCFLVPTGYKDKFNLQYPMRKTGHLRAKDHMVFLSVYAPYLFSFTTIKASFKHFMARFASEMRKLLNPCIVASELDAIIESIYEMRAIQEGLFPDCEQYFIFHEIIDIVNHIKKFGHVRGLMCFFGERALAKVRRLVQKGGVNYMKALYHAYVALENCIGLQGKTNKVTHSDFYDNSGRYSEFVLKLIGNCDRITFTDYMKNKFLGSIISFVESQCIALCAQKSALYRVYLLYQYVAVKKNKEDCHVDGLLEKASKAGGFAQYVRLLYLAGKTFKDEGGDIMSHFEGLVRGVDMHSDQQSFDNDSLSTDGIMFISDLDGIVGEVALFAPLVFSKVIIKGKHFRLRGPAYSEDEVQVRTVEVSGKAVLQYSTYVKENEVEHSWHVATQYSAWMQLTNYRTTFSRAERVLKVSKGETMVGQGNYALRAVFPSDMIVNGLMFVNISIHRSSVSEQRGKVHCIDAASRVNSYNGKEHFFCANYIDSTGLIVSALDSFDFPIYKSEAFSGRTYSNEKDQLRLSTTNVLSKLYLIPMHPERVTFQYDSVEKDENGTKLFEKSAV